MKIINILLVLVTWIGSIIVLFTSGYSLVNLLKILSIFLTITLPYMADSLFKIQIKETNKFVFILFVFMAHFLGVILNFYDTYYYYDKIMHFLSGIVSSLFGLNILLKYKNGKIFNSFGVISIALAVATLWEIYEYIASLLFKIDPQNVLLTGINDTMIDIIVAFIGSIIVVIIYNLNKKNA